MSNQAELQYHGRIEYNAPDGSNETVVINDYETPSEATEVLLDVLLRGAVVESMTIEQTDNTDNTDHDGANGGLTR